VNTDSKQAMPTQQPRGLDLTDLDHITPEEVAAFHDSYMRVQGRHHVGFEYLLNNNPSALKRWRLFAKYAAIPLDQQLILTATNFALVAWYALLGFEEGVRYQVYLQQVSGRSTREQVNDGLGLSFFYCGPRGAEIVANTLGKYDWLEPEEPADFSEWNTSAHLLSAGLDFSTEEMLPGELQLIEDWYLRAVGSVPDFVRFLAEYRPGALKAYRNRYENQTKTLPAQLVPLVAAKIAMYRGDPELLREHMAIARYLGVSKADAVMNAISGALYGGMESLNMLKRVAGDILDNWEQPAGS
jgi:hypothetical protein